MKNEKIVFTLENAINGLHIPPVALKIAGLCTDKALEYRTLPGALVAFKKQMTMLELVNAANSLQTLADELFCVLCDVCGDCEHCSEECPYSTADFEMELDLPEPLLERAGIPRGAKLFATATDGGVLICPAEKMPSLQSVPGELMEQIISCDVCPGELEDHIIRGDIVYGAD